MQERLAQQQKAMAEERTYLKEIISRMDSQLSEQQRQLEKVSRLCQGIVVVDMCCYDCSRNALVDPQNHCEASFYLLQERWKVTAEQAKAESTQRGLEEERRVFTMQINMEREELERAKVRPTSVSVVTEALAVAVQLHHVCYASFCLLELIAGGAEVCDAALCRGEEKTGSRVGSLPHAGETEA